MPTDIPISQAIAMVSEKHTELMKKMSAFNQINYTPSAEKQAEKNKLKRQIDELSKQRTMLEQIYHFGSL